MVWVLLFVLFLLLSYRAVNRLLVYLAGKEDEEHE